MKTNFGLTALAAGVSLAALSAASGAMAQSLVNPVAQGWLTSAGDAPASEMPSSYIQPRIGVQVAATDNVTMVNTNKVSDFITRATLGADARFDNERVKADLTIDGMYEFYSKQSSYNTFNYRGQGSASYMLVPETLAIEAAGARTQGSLTTFGSTDFYRSGNSNDFQVTTYYVGPHLTFRPGNLVDVSAAARYGQVYYDAPSNLGVAPLANATTVTQVIGAADTKERLGRLRIVASGQYEQDDKFFKNRAGAASAFYQVTPRFTGIVRAGYDDVRLATAVSLSKPFWSVGGQYAYNDRVQFRVEGGQRFGEPYYSGDAAIRLSRNVGFLANFSNTLAPGPIAISNILVDSVGGLDQPLPLPIAPPAFQLTNSFYNQPSLNRTGGAHLVASTDRQTLDLEVIGAQQKFLTVAGENNTVSYAATYQYKLRPDLTGTLRYQYATQNLRGFNLGGVSTPGKGSYSLGTIRLEYQINSLMSASAVYQNRKYDPSAATPLVRYTENIGSLALIRKFW